MAGARLAHGWRVLMAGARLARAHGGRVLLAGTWLARAHGWRVLSVLSPFCRRNQILVATSTLAWGVNSPTHLVIIKGTEFFDAKAHRYVDMPITDVLQMMGRAGRPQYDDSGIAVVYVQDVKKNFYKKFLYEPFPVESSLHTQLTDHLNAEVRMGTKAIGTLDAV